MPEMYDHSGQSKQTQWGVNKPPCEPYFEYDPNPEILNQRKEMFKIPKKDPDAVVIHKFCLVINLTFLIMGLYFLAKLLFLLYNMGDSVECFLNYPAEIDY